MLFLIIIIIILIYLFFILNSIIWLNNKKINNINDNVIKYVLNLDFIIYSILLLFILYLYYNNLSLKIY